MALITTIGGALSDSFVTLAEYQTYGGAMGWTLGADDAADEVNLRRAALYLGRNYTFTGLKQYQVQALAWPRLVGGLVDDWPIDPDTIPQAIKNAQSELAYLIQGGLDPFATIDSNKTGDMIKVGPITIDETTTPTSRPRLVAIEGLLRPYITSGAGQMRMVRG